MSINSTWLAGIAAAAIVVAPAATAQTFRYEKMCEASAAARVDGAYFAVASDDSATIQIYERGKAEPVGSLKLNKKVTDIEAAARIDRTVFWLTSHSFSKNKKDKPGKDKAERKLFFATRISGKTLVEAGTDYAKFRELVARALAVAEADIAPQLNIEGLAATPDGALLVGLRGPLTGDGRAHIVRIEAPFALVGLDPPEGLVPSATPVHHWALALGGRGIRSIEQVGTGAHLYLIVAGPAGDNPTPEPALYWWDGQGDAVPFSTAVPLHKAPEALIAWDEHMVQILGDNEALENGGKCSDKDPGTGWFPSIDVRF